jgi:hypothetical protein
MCACYRRHVPEDADVVFVEYAVNDDDRREPAFNNAVRCGAGGFGPCPSAPRFVLLFGRERGRPGRRRPS